MIVVQEDNLPREVLATSMAVSRNGQNGIFCGQNEILLLNFDESKRKRKESGLKSTDPICCQWNKCNNDLFVISLNNTCRLYDGELGRQQQLVGGHSRSVSSIDWHPTAAQLLATASAESTYSICIWDTRQSAIRITPIKVEWRGCSLLKWARYNVNKLATVSSGSAGADIRFWDTRKMNSPVDTIVSAHSMGAVINDMDWHSIDDGVLMSCGTDRKIKIWNLLESVSYPVQEIEEMAGFSRCKFDYLGNFLTLSASESINENHTTYWDYPEFHKICSSFPSNITHFEWKSFSNDSCQFVSLHRNFEYKIWQIDTATYYQNKRRRGTSSFNTGFENIDISDRFYLSPSPDQPFGPVGPIETLVNNFKNDMMAPNIISHHSDPNLILREKHVKLGFDDQELRQREFDRLNNNNQVTYEKYFDSRTVYAHFTLINIKCSIQFNYRSLGDTVFLDVKVLHKRAEKIRTQNLEELEKILKNTIDECLRTNTLAIEKCIDVAIDYLNKLSSRFSLRNIRSIKEQSTPNASYCSLPDVRVPFPRICGATFSPNGFLVCFVSPPGYINRFHSIPRSLADINKHINPASANKGLFLDINSKNTLQKQYHKSSVRKLKSSEFNFETPSRKYSFSGNQKLINIVFIHDALHLSLFSVSLAKKYSVDVSNIESMCQKNAAAVADSNRKDLIEFWQYCAILANGCRATNCAFYSYIKPWPLQLMGRRSCEMWMEYFKTINDIQSVAMLVLVMRAIDADLDSLNDKPNDYLSFAQGGSINKNVSQESLMDNTHPDNMSPNVCVGFVSHGSQMFQLYDDKRNSTIIVSEINGDSPGRFRNNSVTENEFGFLNKKSDAVNDISFQNRDQCRLIDPKKSAYFNSILLHYVHMLTAQNLLNKSAKIIQKIVFPTFFNYFPGQYKFDVFFLKNCYEDHKCQSVYFDEKRSCVVCKDCQSRNIGLQDLVIKTPIMCSVCRLFVRGLFFVCSQCNHGGHINHINSWFSRNGIQSVCPTGCGCACSSFRDSFHDLLHPISVN